MAVKTITITEGAYEALKARKEKHESFSELALRLAGKRPLSDFFGALSGESANRLEEAVKKIRKRDTRNYEARVKAITSALDGKSNGSS